MNTSTQTETVQLIVTGPSDIAEQIRSQLPHGYVIPVGRLFHATVDAMWPMPASWSNRKRAKRAGQPVTNTSDWCRTVLDPLAGVVWPEHAQVLPSLQCVWSYVTEPETWIEIELITPPTARAVTGAITAFDEAVNGSKVLV
jgi:hypothetical protein